MDSAQCRGMTIINSCSEAMSKRYLHETHKEDTVCPYTVVHQLMDFLEAYAFDQLRKFPGSNFPSWTSWLEATDLKSLLKLFNCDSIDVDDDFVQ